MEGIEIRESVSNDLASIEKLYPDAFPDEDLLPIVMKLLQETSVSLSLVAIIGSSLAGHIIFTKCNVDGFVHKVSLLGPLAVAPASQRLGIGIAIVRAGVQRLENDKVACVYVLGDPAYYGRFGFMPETEIDPPYSLPDEWNGAWQSLSLSDKGAPPGQGRLTVPQPWLQPKLWGP